MVSCPSGVDDVPGPAPSPAVGCRSCRSHRAGPKRTRKARWQMKTFTAVLLGLLMVGGLAVVVVGVRSGRRLRSTRGAGALLVPAGLTGSAFVCFALAGAGFWHFGGREDGPDDGAPFR